MIEDDLLDELIFMGGALIRGAERIEKVDVDETFHRIKKDFQPIIRGKAVTVLQRVRSSRGGWVLDMEPLLQRAAVVEYENDGYWLDVRYSLKAFIASLPDEPAAPAKADV